MADSGFRFVSAPLPVWNWHVFGSKDFTIVLPREVSRLARFTTRVMLGSTWERYADTDAALLAKRHPWIAMLYRPWGW